MLELSPELCARVGTDLPAPKRPVINTIAHLIRLFTLLSLSVPGLIGYYRGETVTSSIGPEKGNFNIH
jgi:hypothetical protein